MKKEISIPLAVIFLSVILVFYKLVFLQEILFFGDNLSLRLPNFIYSAVRIKEGHLPLWNPYSFAGIPFFADISTAVLSPFTLLFLILDPFSALSLSTLLAISFGGLFSFFLAKTFKLSNKASLVVSLCFMFSSSLMHYTTYFNLLLSSIFMPLTFLALHKWLYERNGRWLKVFSFSVGLQIISGHPQPMLYTLIAVFFYALALPTTDSTVKRLAKLFLGIVLGFGLAGAVVIPAYELTQQSTREALTFEMAAADSLHPLLLVRVLLPQFFDHPQLGVAWGPSWRQVADNTGYTGIVSLFLIASSLFTGRPLAKFQKYLFKFFAALAAASLILALGKYTPVYEPLFKTIPFLRLFRGPAESLVLFNFSLAFLSGIALDRINNSEKVSKYIKNILAAALLVTVFSIIVFLIAYFRFDLIWMRLTEFHTFARDQKIAKMISANLSIAALLIALASYSLRKRLLYLLPALVLIDLFIFNSRYIFTLPRKNLQTSSKAARVLNRELTAQDRFLSYQDLEPFTGLGNYWENMVLRPPFADSYYTQAERETADILNQRLDHLALNWNLVHGLASVNGYSSFVLQDFADFVSPGLKPSKLNNVDLSLISQEKLDELAVSFVLTPEGVIERKTSLPRARVMDQEGKFTDKARIVVNKPELVAVEVKVDEPAKLILADSFYPGWQAHVNGEKVEIEKFKDVFRSVSLESGENTVEFSFKPKTLKLGMLSSLISAAILFFSSSFFKTGKLKRQTSV